MPADASSKVVADGLPIGRLAEIPTKWFLLTTKITEDPIGPSTTRAFLRSTRQVAGADAAGARRGVARCRGRVERGLPVRGRDDRPVSGAGDRCRQLRTRLPARDAVLRGDSLACFGDVTDVWPWFPQPRPLRRRGQRTRGVPRGDRSFGRRSIEQYWRDVRFDTIPRRTSGKDVTLFTNLTWDSAVINKEIAFPTIQEWIADTIRFFACRPEHELVIRIHPAEVTLAGKPTREPLSPFIHETFPTLPENVIVVEPEDITSSYPLMAESDAVTVFTSTTGLEAAARGQVRVIVAGETHYRDKGFTLDVDDPARYHASLESVLDDTSDVRPDIELVRRYANLSSSASRSSSPQCTSTCRGSYESTSADSPTWKKRGRIRSSIASVTGSCTVGTSDRDDDDATAAAHPGRRRPGHRNRPRAPTAGFGGRVATSGRGRRAVLARTARTASRRCDS